MTPVQQIAEIIHRRTCHWNHTDGCSWEYESWEKPGYAKQAGLVRAEKVLATARQQGVTPAQIVAILESV